MKTSSKLSLTALAVALVGAAGAAVHILQQGAEMKETADADTRCYGVVKAGENDCAAADGSHGCHTQTKVSYSGQDFKLVPDGTCEKMKGKLKPFTGVNPDMKEG